MVPETEVESYRHIPLPIVPIPDAVSGISRVRNWILRRFDQRVVVMFDDDITRCKCFVGLHYRQLTKSETYEVIGATAQCAIDAGVGLFGWAQVSDPRKVDLTQPFHLNRWVGGAVGVVGREIWWDENLSLKCDIDATLTELLHRRIVWTDDRFSFEQVRNTNTGGSATFRSRERIDREMRYLKQKWGSVIKFGKYEHMEKVSISAKRRQKISI